MSTPYAFDVNGETFFRPHPGVQEHILQRLIARVLRGEGPSKIFLRGKRGGGKSVLCRKGLLHWLALAVPGLRYVVVRRNMPDLRLNHLQYLGREMRALGGTYHETHGIAKYANGSIGFYRQCEEEADVEQVTGAEAAVLFVDEAPQIKWQWLRTMSPSVRIAKSADGTQPYYSLEVYGGNPIGESIEELDKYCLEKDVDRTVDADYMPGDWDTITIGLEDNPSLDPVEYRKQFVGLSPAYLAAWRDGIRVEDRTLFDVYPSKDGTPYHYIHELPTVAGVPLLNVAHPGIQVYRAFDMGYFPDPAVCVWFVVVGRRIIAVHEDTWFRTTAKDLAAKMIETTKELVGDTPCAMTYVDPTIAIKTGVDVTVMDTLEMNGVPCEASINDRIMYADAIHGLLGEELSPATPESPAVPRFQIYVPGCPMLAKYLPKMRWDEKNQRKMADHQFDHWIVCLGYFGISSGVLTYAAKETNAPEPVWQQWIRESVNRGTGRRAGA